MLRQKEILKKNLWKSYLDEIRNADEADIADLSRFFLRTLISFLSKAIRDNPSDPRHPRSLLISSANL